MAWIETETGVYVNTSRLTEFRLTKGHAGAVTLLDPNMWALWAEAVDGSQHTFLEWDGMGGRNLVARLLGAVEDVPVVTHENIVNMTKERAKCGVKP